MTYKPISITADLYNTVQTTPGYVKLKDNKVMLPWSYVEKSDVKATPATNFIFVTTSTIEIKQEWDKNTLPQTVTFFRETDIETATVFYPGASIRAKDLNQNFNQLLLKLEELDYAQKQ